MKQIRVLKPFSTHNGQGYRKDKTYMVSDELAADLIENGLAESNEPTEVLAEILAENKAGVCVTKGTPEDFIVAMKALGVPIFDESPAQE